MKIYTRQGDGGMTRLANGQTVSKSSCQIKELGVLDEFNAALGVALAAIEAEPKLQLPVDVTLLQRAQGICLYSGALVARAKQLVLANLTHTFSERDIGDLEQRIDDLTAVLPELTQFILPGGSPAAAFVHQARAICRRAERVLLGSAVAADLVLPRQYLNRLSDYLFTLARFCNQQLGVRDTIWR